MSPQEFMHVDYSKYNEDILLLAFKIRRDDWEPDQIVCIGRGGMQLGDALSRLFSKTLGVVMCASYGGGMQRGKLSIAQHISMIDKLSGRILLVDDLVDSGETLKILKNLMEVRQSIDVKTAVIYKKESSKFNPDYHAESIEKHVWIVLPNECFDQIDLELIPKNLLTSMSDKSLSELSRACLANLPKNPIEKLSTEEISSLYLAQMK